MNTTVTPKCIICSRPLGDEDMSEGRKRNKYALSCTRCLRIIKRDKIKLSKVTACEWFLRVLELESRHMQSWVWSVIWWDWIFKSGRNALDIFRYNHRMAAIYSPEDLLLSLTLVGYHEIHASLRVRSTKSTETIR